MTRANVDTRHATGRDRDTLRGLYQAAFPDEDLLPLIDALWDDPSGVLMLVTDQDGKIAGHIAFTPCSMVDQDARLSLLGPLAVHPLRQRLGIGSALVRAGLQRLRGAGTMRVFVLGDPAFYGRFGFTADALLAPPYPLPEEWGGAWQSLALQGETDHHGTLSVPACWQAPALWGPNPREEDIHARSGA